MFRFEPLEKRALLAGNVMATVTGGELDITGDAAGNSVQVWQTGADTWKVQGIATTINGSHATYLATGVTGNIEANLMAGNNFIKVFNGTVPGALGITAEGGNDTVQVTNVSTGLSTAADSTSLVINAGDGKNTVALSGVITSGQTQIISGNGTAVISLANVTVNAGSVSGSNFVETGNGTAAISFSHVSMTMGTGDNFVDTGNGTAAISLSHVTMTVSGGDNFVDTGSGKATIALANVSMNSAGGDNFVDTGGGTANVALVNVKMITTNADNFIDTGNGAAAISLIDVTMSATNAANFVDTGNGTAAISISKSTITNSGAGSENFVATGNGTAAISISNSTITTSGADSENLLETGSGTAVISLSRVMLAADGSNEFTMQGDGKDVVALANVTVNGDLAINTNGGTDAVSLNTVNVGSNDLSVEVGPGNLDSLAVVNCTAGTEEFSDTGGTNGSIVGALNHFATAPLVTGFTNEFGI